MQEKLLSIILTEVMFLGTLDTVRAKGTEAAAVETIEGAVVLPAAEAVFTEGEGISADNEAAETIYSEKFNMITNLAQFTSQPFVFSINGGDTFSIPINCLVPADSGN